MGEPHRPRGACDTLHTVCCLHYHALFITKYRKSGAAGRHRPRGERSRKEICRTLDIEIVQGHIRPERVHLVLSVPPHLAEPSHVGD